MSENLKAYENEIRADERKKVGKALEALYKRALKIGEWMDNLVADIGKFNDAHHPVERSNGSAPQVKAKRKPVGFTIGESEAVVELLGSEPLSVKGFRIPGMSARKVGAILRQFVKTGVAVEQPKGKYRAAAQPAVADGAGE